MMDLPSLLVSIIYYMENKINEILIVYKCFNNAEKMGVFEHTWKM